MHYLINFISGTGVVGLLIIMALEGLSLPLPGVIVILTLEYVLHLSILKIILIAMAMSFTYSIASYIPYLIGLNLEKTIRKKYEKQIQTTRDYFQKYGEYSIALLRPFAAGNYISYFAGMNRMKIWKYLLLTFI